MNIPKLKKIKNEKKYHDIPIQDDYAWVDQSNILDVLKDTNKLLPDVREYIEKMINYIDGQLHVFPAINI